MRRLIRSILWLGAAAAVLWLARSALKSFVDGPEVTPASGGWPDSAGARSATPAMRSAPATAPASANGGTARPESGGGTGNAGADGKGTPTPKPRKAAGASKTGAAKDTAAPKAAGRKAAAGAKKASRAAKKPAARSSDSGEPAVWAVPNGTAEVLQTHPVKVKLSSRVYRVPGMPMYDRTVADRCYPTVEAAEADGFTRAAR